MANEKYLEKHSPDMMICNSADHRCTAGIMDCPHAIPHQHMSTCFESRCPMAQKEVHCIRVEDIENEIEEIE